MECTVLFAATAVLFATCVSDGKVETMPLLAHGNTLFLLPQQPPREEPRRPAGVPDMLLRGLSPPVGDTYRR